MIQVWMGGRDRASNKKILFPSFSDLHPESIGALNINDSTINNLNVVKLFKFNFEFWLMEEKLPLV